MAKQLLFDQEARSALMDGIDALANAVKITLGPRGRNVVLAGRFGSPTITNDGVTIAREIDLAEPFANMGAQLAKEIASQTNDIAGDGTTTATVLGQAIVAEGLKNVMAGADPMALKRGIDKAKDLVIERLREIATPVTERQQMAQVAAIAANNDEQIGDLIGEVMEKIGKDGVVTVEESNGIKTEVEYVEGMQFDRGYVSAYFVTDPDKMVAELEDAYILITDNKLSGVADILPILERVLKVSQNLMIICEDCDGQALATLAVNKLKGTINVVAVKAPGFGDRREESLGDIAALTGGTVISDKLGRRLDSADIEDLGRARRVIVSKDESTIVEGRGDKEAMAGRIAQIKGELQTVESDWDREKLQERLGKLAGSVAVIKVGAATETELKERKHRVEDALSATRAAIEEGIVPGGGIALINALAVLDNVNVVGDELTGVLILRHALVEPLRRIAINADQDGSVILEKVKALATGEGYDAARDDFSNMIERGIIDPLKVTRSALENAVSIAGMVMTTNCLVTDFPE